MFNLRIVLKTATVFVNLTYASNKKLQTPPTEDKKNIRNPVVTVLISLSVYPIPKFSSILFKCIFKGKTLKNVKQKHDITGNF